MASAPITVRIILAGPKNEFLRLLPLVSLETGKWIVQHLEKMEDYEETALILANSTEVNSVSSAMEMMDAINEAPPETIG